jgi:hypothetical protein
VSGEVELTAADLANIASALQALADSANKRMIVRISASDSHELLKLRDKLLLALRGPN